MTKNCDKQRQLIIEVPGLPVDVQPIAQEDIKRLVSALRRVGDELGNPFLLERVLISGQFEQDVNGLLKERSGFSGYHAVRKNVHAVGKTFWVRSDQGDLGFVVVIDANHLGAWSLNNARWLTTVLHELTHVLYEARHLKTLGEKEYTAIGDTRERWLNRWACMILDEFDVDRTVDAVIREMAMKEDGQHWSLRELEEAQGVDWSQSLFDALNRMPQFIDEHVWRFRTRRMNINELAGEVIPFVNDLLVLVSHTAALYLETAQWLELMRRIKETEAGRRFLRDHLDSIVEEFDDKQTQFTVALERVSGAVERIFGNCGLGFKTVDNGVYISVAEPLR
jgi:hypothetical protein